MSSDWLLLHRYITMTVRAHPVHPPPPMHLSHRFPPSIQGAECHAPPQLPNLLPQSQITATPGFNQIREILYPTTMHQVTAGCKGAEFFSRITTTEFGRAGFLFGFLFLLGLRTKMLTTGAPREKVQHQAVCVGRDFHETHVDDLWLICTTYCVWLN